MDAIASLRGVEVVRQERTILAINEFTVQSHERWALLGPNGSGKSTLLAVLSGRLWPTRGEVTLLGQRVGTFDLRTQRARLGLLSATLTRQLRPALRAHDVVLTGIDGALEPWWREYDESDHRRADEVLVELGVGHLAEQFLGVLSEGERARVLLGRVLIAQPALICLDEPAAGLDLGAREQLLERLGALFDQGRAEPVVLVTHHLEELPRGLTHGALLRDGGIVAQGPIDEVLTTSLVSSAFDVAVEVVRHDDGRFSARSRADRSR